MESFGSWERVEGMGRTCDARRTEYWRSQTRRTMLRVGEGVIAVSSTRDVFRATRETSPPTEDASMVFPMKVSDLSRSG
jgi:hypothetical protein